MILDSSLSSILVCRLLKHCSWVKNPSQQECPVIMNPSSITARVTMISIQQIFPISHVHFDILLSMQSLQKCPRTEVPEDRSADLQLHEHRPAIVVSSYIPFTESKALPGYVDKKWIKHFFHSMGWRRRFTLHSGQNSDTHFLKLFWFYGNMLFTDAILELNLV